MKVGVLQAVLGQPVEGRRTRRPAERTHVTVANVVPTYDQHIGVPSGARSGSGKSAVESVKATLISPRKGGSGGGRIDRSRLSGWVAMARTLDHPATACITRSR